jgi:CBS domain-containing membrane protein
MIRIGNETVTSIMTKEIVSVSPGRNLKDVLDLMIKNSFRHVVVTTDGALVGIISKNDIDKFILNNKTINNDLQNKLVENLSVEQLMTKNVHTLSHDDSIKEAAELISLGSYHALPVLDGSNLVGILTSTDLILYLLRHCE